MHLSFIEGLSSIKVICHSRGFKFNHTSLHLIVIGSKLTCLLFDTLAKPWHSNKSARKENNRGFVPFNQGETSEEYTPDNLIGELSQSKLQELVLFNFENLATATNNFHSSNKLGQGGFGPVYKVD